MTHASFIPNVIFGFPFTLVSLHIRPLISALFGLGHKVDRTKSDPRRLSVEEIQELRRDMQESSAWAKAELKRRRVAKNQKNSAHGIDDGIDKDHLSN